MTENTQERQFSIQRIYTKDISFETPNTPEIFMQEWKPQVNVNLNNAVKDLGEGNLEVCPHRNRHSQDRGQDRLSRGSHPGGHLPRARDSRGRDGTACWASTAPTCCFPTSVKPFPT